MLRIQGVVRAARQAQEKLHAGVPESEREAFLDEVAAVVGEIEAACAGYDQSPLDLPAPSRRAYEALRNVAALRPADLPAPVEGDGEGDAERGAPAAGTLRISNVVGTLNRTLDALAATDAGAPVATATTDAARACVESVESICQNHGTTPAALPPRSGQAYAMLKWLLAEGNLERYLDRRDAVLAVVRRVLAALDPLDPMAIRIASIDPDLLVRFEPGRHTYRLRGRGTRLHIRLGVGFLAADDADLACAAEVLLRKKQVSSPALARYRDFVDSEDFGAMSHELRRLAGDAAYRSRGRAYDLDALFDRLNDEFFSGRMARPHLDWHAGEARGRFGFYMAARDLVCVDRRLDDAGVPEFVAEFVLYHELLHKKHGAEQRGRRRHVHTAAFRADERRHPRQAEAETWLDRLASDRGRSKIRTLPRGASGPGEGRSR